MNSVLIVYDSISGSTKEHALGVQKVLRSAGLTAVLSRYSEVTDMNNFETVIIGSPMRYAFFNGNISRFIERFREDLSRRRVYLFFTLMFIEDGDEAVTPGDHIFLDPRLLAASEAHAGSSGKEGKYSLLSYMNKIKAGAPWLSPAGMAFLGGRLDLSTIGFLEKLVMKFTLPFKTMRMAGDLVEPASAEEWASRVLRVDP